MWSYLISSSYISIIVSISNLSASNVPQYILLTLILLICSSKDVAGVEKFFCCSMILDENLFVVYFRFGCILKGGVFLIWNEPVHFQSSLVLNNSFLSNSSVHSIENQTDKSWIEVVWKLKFWQKWWSWCSNFGGVSRYSNVIIGSISCAYGGKHNEKYRFCWAWRLLRFHLKTIVLLKIIVICR